MVNMTQLEETYVISCRASYQSLDREGVQLELRYMIGEEAQGCPDVGCMEEPVGRERIGSRELKFGVASRGEFEVVFIGRAC